MEEDDEQEDEKDGDFICLEAGDLESVVEECLSASATSAGFHHKRTKSSGMDFGQESRPKISIVVV